MVLVIRILAQVVRQMKEELCYVAFNPAAEEKVPQPDTVYKLPDGQTVRVIFRSIF